ncbi:amidohydrolase family protein [Roseateles toxinivorans]|uniref:Imidazolonepropionase-like amidohydrolase n=1 Tax=Roseateles toxinivorans TaxID=270368 RepID=A0A4R6QDJ1_9BURK|nr:amidohydrolase family protein [Roseateles toxinivorans]TDP60455.1 imidazolonepropionase-like amidohydrolase [Roseateles toxinivorans]
MTTSPPLAIEHTRVATLRGNEVLHDHTVLVRNGRIERLGPSALLPAPADATRIDGSACTLLPGLCDMHVHLLPSGIDPTEGVPDEASAWAQAEAYLKRLLDAGLTTVRNMAGTPWHLRVRDAVNAGRIPGPRIVTAGPILETRFSFAAMAAFGKLVTSVEQGRAEVHAQAAAGYDFIKVYNDLDPDIYDAIVATARELGLPVAGHVPFGKGLFGALAARQDSIEHFRSYDFALDVREPAGKERFVGWLHSTPARMRELAERTAEAGSWNVPTLVIEEALARSIKGDSADAPWIEATTDQTDLRSVFSPAALAAIAEGLPLRQQLLAAMDHSGARLLAGSDCPGCGLIPGQSLHRELQLMVQAGLSPLRALQTATANAAEYLGLRGQQGQIIEGQRADLLLIEGNATSDLAALSNVRGVATAGTWHTPAGESS